MFFGPFIRPTSDVNFSQTVCLIYIKISQIFNIGVDRKLLKFHVNQTNLFRDIDVGRLPFVFAVHRCRTLLPYVVAVHCCRTLFGTVRHGSAELWPHIVRPYDVLEKSGYGRSLLTTRGSCGYNVRGIPPYIDGVGPHANRVGKFCLPRLLWGTLIFGKYWIANFVNNVCDNNVMHSVSQ